MCTFHVLVSYIIDINYLIDQLRVNKSELHYRINDQLQNLNDFLFSVMCINIILKFIVNIKMNYVYSVVLFYCVRNVFRSILL